MIKSHNDPAILKKASEIIRSKDGVELINLVSQINNNNHDWRETECFNFLAAESPQSELSLSALGSSLGKRSAGGGIGPSNRYVQGTDYIDQIEALYYELMRSKLDASFVDFRPLGGVSACHIVYAALTKPGDIVLSLSELCGGDPVHRANGAPGVLKLEVYDIPFDHDNYEINYMLLEEKISHLKPQIISIGQSNCLFPVDYKRIRTILKSHPCILLADIAHQTGLICANSFPNPLIEGADIIVGTTGKTFSGPHGGIIAWNNSNFSKSIFHMSSPVYTGTHQVNRILSSLISAIEIHSFGDEYMAKIIKNSYIFANYLNKNGLEIIGCKKDFTRTHQVLFKAESLRHSSELSEKLEEANLIVSTTRFLNNEGQETGGIRLGFTEITRLGLERDDLIVLANLFLDCLLDRRDVSLIKKDVVLLRSKFTTYKYCYEGSFL